MQTPNFYIVRSWLNNNACINHNTIAIATAIGSEEIANRKNESLQLLVSD